MTWSWKFHCKISSSKFSKKKWFCEFRKKKTKKKTDFDDKLKNLNKNVTSNKTKHVLIKKGLNELLEKVKAISTKGLTKDLITE